MKALRNSTKVNLLSRRYLRDLHHVIWITLRDAEHRTLDLHRDSRHMIWITLRDLYHVIDTTSKNPHF